MLYVGQVELENIGLKGTPADTRRYSNERFAEVFWAARDVAQTMDELGYYALWTAEHHFQREGYECFPNLIQLSLWLATQTKRPCARSRRRAAGAPSKRSRRPLAISRATKQTTSRATCS